VRIRYPPAIAPMIINGSAPDAMASGERGVPAIRRNNLPNTRRTQKSAAFVRYVVADRALQHRIGCFERVEDRALRHRAFDGDLHFNCRRPQAFAGVQEARRGLWIES